MDSKSGGDSKKDHGYVTTGDEIPVEPGFLRGHGTLLRDGKLIATVSGFIERVNKLVSVRPLNTRYTGEIGDVVIGRIVEVADKRWRLDLNSRQNAILMLSSVNLPGGVQRRRTDEDSLQMRSLYEEDDLVSAEVQNLMHDGAISLHTRSLKYGKLENGQFLSVPSSLIKRSKQHFHTLPSIGVDLILGLNGYVWVAPNLEADAIHKSKEAKLNARKLATATAAAAAATATATDTKSSAAGAAAAASAAAHALSLPGAISATVRENVCRVRNSVLALASSFIAIHTGTVMDVYDESIALGIPAKDMCSDPDQIQRITQAALARTK